MVRSVLIAAPLALALALTGCNKDSGSTTSGGTTSGGGAKTATATAEAREVYKSRCATCHGEAGKGDGPAGAALNPKPRNYTDKEGWCRPTSSAWIVSWPSTRAPWSRPSATR